MNRTNLAELQRRFDGTTDKAELRQLVEDIKREHRDGIMLLTNEDSKQAREAIHDELYELTVLKRATQGRLTHIARKEMKARG